MPAALLSNGTILVDESIRAEAKQVTKKVHDRVVRGLRLVLDDGQEISLPTDLVGFLGNVLSGLSRGGVSVTLLPEELTTTVAAELLGVSRPTLMKWVRAGEIPSHPVGSHTRLKLADVLAHGKALHTKRAVAFDALRAWEEEFEPAGE